MESLAMSQNVLPTFGSPTLEDLDASNLQVGERVRGKSRQLVRFYKKTFMEIQADKVKITTLPNGSTTTQVLSTKAVPVEKEMVMIITPGDKNSVDDVATDWHKREFWPQYKAFRDGKTAPLGTSLDECSFISPNVATELRYLGCHTVEQLADASDLLCNQIANGWELREFARCQVKAASGNSNSQVSALKVDLETALATIAKMKEAQEQMQSTILDLQGRPTAREDAPAKREKVKV